MKGYHLQAPSKIIIFFENWPEKKYHNFVLQFGLVAPGNFNMPWLIGLKKLSNLDVGTNDVTTFEKFRIITNPPIIVQCCY